MKKKSYLGMMLSAALLAACGGGDGDDSGVTPEPVLVTKVDGRYKTSKQSQIPSFQAFSLPDAGALPNLHLPTLDNEKTVLLSGLGGLQQVGADRPLHATESVQKLSDFLEWKPSQDDRKVAAIRVSADDAFGLRLGVLIKSLPDAATLHLLRGVDETEAFTISGQAINSLLAANQAAGENSEDARTWWSPDLGGDSVILVFSLPTDVETDALRVALPKLSHIYADISQYGAETASADAKNVLIGESGACQLDVTCQSTGNAQRDAVARMVFVEAGKSYLCTGTLMNDAIASDIPYFLTANHCISTQTVASTLQTDWFLRTASCNGNSLDGRYRLLAGGAKLLFTNNTQYGQDTTLLVLNDEAPTGSYFAGWDANLNNTVQSVYGIHHPDGDLAKISLGTVDNYANCDGSGSCPIADTQTGRYYRAQWTSGTTEGGSSGSALFSQTGHVYGVLHGGSASCSVLGGSDFYGRFDRAFDAGVKNYLAATQRPNL